MDIVYYVVSLSNFKLQSPKLREGKNPIKQYPRDFPR